MFDIHRNSQSVVVLLSSSPLVHVQRYVQYWMTWNWVQNFNNNGKWLQGRDATHQPLLPANGSARGKCHKFFFKQFCCVILSCKAVTYWEDFGGFFYIILHFSAAYDSSPNYSLRIEGNNYVDIVLHSRFVENK